MTTADPPSDAPVERERSYQLDIPRPADADALAEVHVRVWREAYAGIVPESAYDDAALERRRRGWGRIVQEPEALRRERMRVARDADGAPVGFLMIGPPREAEAPRPWELQALNVLADCHGRGVAQALVADLLGERPAYLWVVEDNPRARRFYEKVGFRADGGLKVDEDLGGLREIRMTR